MRIIGKVKYNGKSTADLGVIVSGEASFDAAAPDYTSYQIPGKNGDLMLSNNRYLNIDVTYPAFIPADFEEKVQAIRNWMRSARSYARIEDNYDLLHFRMGMGKDVLPFEPSAENVGSNMSLVFDCKPQRFLYSGEEENQIGVWGPVQAASGDVVTFEDDENGAFKSIAASITPTQDLHGYDYPWPAGGGKNLLDSTSYSRLQNCTIVDGVVTATVSDTRQQIWPVCQLYDGTEYVRGTERIGESFSWRFTKTNDVNVIAFGHTGASKDIKIYYPIAHLKDGMEYVFSANVISAIEPFSWDSMMICDSTADYNIFTPYSNICPITGRTEATVWRTGKNLLDTKTVQSGLTTRFYTDDDGYVTAVPTNSDSRSWSYANSQWKLFVPRGDYVFSWEIKTPSTVSSQGVRIYGSNDEILVNRVTSTIFTQNGSINLNIENNMMIGIIAKIYDGAIRFMFRKSSDAADYTPYSGDSYPVSWQSEAGTVYGGSVDVVSGTLTVDKTGIVFNGSENWTPYGKEGYYLRLNTMKKSRNYEGAIICDKLPTFRSSYAQEYYDAAYGIAGWTGTTEPNNNYIYVKGGEIVATSAGTIKAWLAENPIQVVYELATPQTYQLSGQQIKTLLGVNNVWADSGTVTAEWGEDPFGLYNPTLFDALPMIKVKNPQNGCTVTVNGTTVTCSRSHTGTVTIDCELMDVSSGATNLNADWSKDFPKLSPGENSVAFSGADAVTIIPRWWEL